jgi:hypothetical protein
MVGLPLADIVNHGVESLILYMRCRRGGGGVARSPSICRNSEMGKFASEEVFII